MAAVDISGYGRCDASGIEHIVRLDAREDAGVEDAVEKAATDKQKDTAGHNGKDQNDRRNIARLFHNLLPFHGSGPRNAALPATVELIEPGEMPVLPITITDWLLRLAGASFLLGFDRLGTSRLSKDMWKNGLDRKIELRRPIVNELKTIFAAPLPVDENSKTFRL